MANEEDNKKLAEANRRQTEIDAAQRRLTNALLHGPEKAQAMEDAALRAQAFADAKEGLAHARAQGNPDLIRSWENKLVAASNAVAQPTEQPTGLTSRQTPALNSAALRSMEVRALDDAIFKAMDAEHAPIDPKLTGAAYDAEVKARATALENALQAKADFEARAIKSVAIADIPAAQPTTPKGPILPGLDARLGAPTNEAATRAEASIRAATSHIPDIDRMAAPKAPRVIIPHFPEVPAAAAAPAPAYPPLDPHTLLNSEAARASEAARIRATLSHITDLPAAAPAPAPQAAPSFVGPSPAEMRSIQAATDGVIPAKAATAPISTVDIDVSTKPASPAPASAAPIAKAPPPGAPLPVLNEAAVQEPLSTVKPSVPLARVNSNSLPPLSGTAAPAAPAPAAPAPAAPSTMHTTTDHQRVGPNADAVRDALNTPYKAADASTEPKKGPATDPGRAGTAQATSDAIHGRNQPPAKPSKVSQPAATGAGIDATRQATQDAARGLNQPAPAPASELDITRPPSRNFNPPRNADAPLSETEKARFAKALDEQAKATRQAMPKIDPSTVFNKEPEIDFRALADKTSKAAKAMGNGAGQTAKAMGDGLKKIPGLLPEVARNSMAPLAYVSTVHAIDVADQKYKAGDKKGAGEVIGDTMGALATGAIAARGLLANGGQGMVAMGNSIGGATPVQSAAAMASKVAGVGLIALAGGWSGKQFMNAVTGENEVRPPIRPLTREQELASIPKPIGWEEAQKPSVMLTPLRASPITNIPVPGVDDARIDMPAEPVAKDIANIVLPQRVAKAEPRIPAPGAPMPEQSETVESVAPTLKSAATAKAGVKAVAPAAAPVVKAEVKAAAPAPAVAAAPATPAAPAAKLPEGKVLHVVQDGETMTDIADARNPAMAKLRKAAAEVLGSKAKDRDKLNVVAIALAMNSGLYEIDKIHANDKILDTSPEAVKAIAQQLKDLRVVDAKGHINPGFQPRDVAKLLNQTPSK